jgi:peptide chain release factor 1
MLKPKTPEEILSEIVKIVNVFDRRYLKSEEQSEWCAKVIYIYNEWQQFRQELIDAKEIEIDRNDEIEWRSIVDLEIVELELKVSSLQQQLKLLLVDIYPCKHRNIFVEICTVSGGDEASIWVEDLVRIYTRYAEQNKYWKIELVSEFNNYSSGGLNKATLEIRGAFAGYFFQFETGIHQLNRRSLTSNSTNIHTSTARVTVMPTIEFWEIEIDLLDLEVYTSSQYHPRTTNINSVSISHKPTGFRVVCSQYLSQFHNKEKALQILVSKLYDLDIQNQLGEDVRSKIVRTYDYPSNCVTDRSSGKIHALDRVVNGELDALITSRAPDCPIIS